MPESANKGAGQLAKELADKLNENSANTVDNEEYIEGAVSESKNAADEVSSDSPIILGNQDFIEGAIQEAENAGNKNLAKALRIFAENEAVKKASSSVDQVKTPDGKVIMRHYRVLVEAITGSSPKVEEQNISTLTGVVTDADLDAAGVDKAWLLKIGSIEDLGYRDA
jgi:hypothetical protein